MKNKGFTIAEVIIACIVLSVFMIGLLNLYSSGSKMGNATMWLQTTTNQLKTATRQINTSINKSSYPSCFTFPQKIKENKDDCFKLRYKKDKLEAISCTEATDSVFGTNFLITTESTPAKQGFQTGNQKATLVYHIFSLAKNGDLIYSKYEDSAEATSFESDFTKSIPSGTRVYKTTLVKNVESVECNKRNKDRADNKPQPIEVIINCVMPRSPNTKRSESAIGTPNVDLKTL